VPGGGGTGVSVPAAGDDHSPSTITGQMTTPLAPSPGIGTAAKAPIVIVNARSRWLAACGWLGIVAGATVFVAALVLPLDDPALVVALMLALRGGQFAVTA
jgi:hypothetical protein